MTDPAAKSSSAPPSAPATPSAPAARPWGAIGAYLLFAIAPMPAYFVLRSASDIPPDDWAGTTPFDAYFGPGLLFHASAVACAYLLLARDARALWPALFVVTWTTLQQVGHVWRWMHGRGDGLFAGLGWIPVVLAVVLAAYVHHLKVQGRLRPHAR